MSDQKEAWERWYRSGPPSWKGSPLPLPELPEGARVLDIGCGTGSTMLQAFEKGCDVVGIDISEAAIERAGERISARGYDANLMSGDILDPSIDLGRFDCILLHHVLDNMVLEKRRRTVQKVKKMLNDEGMISFQDLSVNDVRSGKGEEIERNTFIKGDGIMLHFFDLEETKELFEGLKVLELEEHEWTQGQGDRKLKKCRIRGIFQLSSLSTLGRTSGA